MQRTFPLQRTVADWSSELPVVVRDRQQASQTVEYNRLCEAIAALNGVEVLLSAAETGRTPSLEEAK